MADIVPRDSMLAGTWLHRQQPDNLSSADECAFSEDDAEPACDNIPHVESGCQFLIRADIAVFDTLLSVSTVEEPSAQSNAELLSMLTADDTLSTTDAAQCDGQGCGSFAESEHVPWNSDDVDGVGTSDMNETLLADNSVSSARPQTGAVIESGSGDLTISPVHLTSDATDSVQTASFQSTCPPVIRPKLSSRPWRTDVASSLSSNEETRYIVEAAELISQAQEHEISENYPAAYSHYRSGIEILVKGVQSTYFV